MEMMEFVISGVGKFESLWRHYKINNLAVLSKIFVCLGKHRGNIFTANFVIKEGFFNSKIINTVLQAQ